MERIKRRRTRLDWSEWYSLARAYKESYGDLLVPHAYESPGGYKLGRWIERQRAKYNETPSMQHRLNRNQISQLEQIGMVWKLESRFAWTEWILEAEKYLCKFGNLEIPHNYKQGEYHLGNWIAEQRKNYMAGRLTEKQIADLDALGMVWNIATPRRAWSDWYEDAKEYYETHGNLLVKLDYCTEAGNRLGVWIFSQRERYRGKKGKAGLNPNQISLLNQLDMVWDLDDSRDDGWERMYGWVAEYREKYGKLPLWPKGQTAPDGRKLDSWIVTQRMNLSSGKTSPERAERLAALGIVMPKKRVDTIQNEMAG